jgi:hypothetical protein
MAASIMAAHSVIGHSHEDERQAVALLRELQR